MIKHVQCAKTKIKKLQLDMLNLEKAKKVKRFHESFPVYSPTPLRTLNHLAEYVGVEKIYVKDESFRFGLNAFKVLGGSYAIGHYMADRLGMRIGELSFEQMISEEIREKLGEVTFISATDGNHGRGVAWTAAQLKQHSVILMPKGSSAERLDRIKAEGADAWICEGNYDDTVRLADRLAEENGWIMVQDTAWEGYEDIPTWIMQGYMTMAYEAYEQLDGVKPTHIFVQAGVGSLAGAVIGFFSSIYKDDRPVMTVVEPEKAACLFETAKADDGERHFVTGDMDTIMAGLACGEPNTVSWEILREYADHFICCPDYMAAQGMRILGNPLGDDVKVIAGESGAAGFGMVMEVLMDDRNEALRRALAIDEHSRILFFNSEGDTDQAGYRRIVWDGSYGRE